MNTQEIADRLVLLCREGNILKAVEELYSFEIISTETPALPKVEAVSKGINLVAQNNIDWFNSIQEFHEITISTPIVAGNHFATKMIFDATRKDATKYYFEELCVYEVCNGKIIKEQFFYDVV